MKRWGKMITGAAMVIGITAGGTLLAAPANAATSDCPSGAACIWGDTMYKTAGNGWAEVGFNYNIPNYSGYTYDGIRSAYSTASSVYNNGRTSMARFYVGVNYTGPSFTLARQMGDGYLLDTSGAVTQLGFDDAIKSGKFI